MSLRLAVWPGLLGGWDGPEGVGLATRLCSAGPRGLLCLVNVPLCVSCPWEGREDGTWLRAAGLGQGGGTAATEKAPSHRAGGSALGLGGRLERHQHWTLQVRLHWWTAGGQSKKSPEKEGRARLWKTSGWRAGALGTATWAREKRSGRSSVAGAWPAVLGAEARAFMSRFLPGLSIHP